MEIHINGGRDAMNQWVEVKVRGRDGQLVANVTTVLDGFAIGDDNLNPPEDSYEHTWNQVGTGGPNQTHKVVVTAMDDKGNQSSASKTWQA
jgi:hypothetical protein